VPETYKIPESVLVVIHTPALEVLMLQRLDHPGYWQSVTGSLDTPGESPEAAAVREVAEETGLEARGRLVGWRIENRFKIFEWRLPLYRPGVTHNTEHVFGLTVPRDAEVRLAPREHTRHRWLPWREAAEQCLSWSNRDAIRLLPTMKALMEKGLL